MVPRGPRNAGYLSCSAVRCLFCLHGTLATLVVLTSILIGFHELHTSVKRSHLLHYFPLILQTLSNLIFAPLPKSRRRTLPPRIRFQGLGNMSRQLCPPTKRNDKVTRLNIRGEAGVKLTIEDDGEAGSGLVGVAFTSDLYGEVLDSLPNQSLPLAGQRYPERARLKVWGAKRPKKKEPTTTYHIQHPLAFIPPVPLLGQQHLPRFTLQIILHALQQSRRTGALIELHPTLGSLRNERRHPDDADP
ncbi:hypothetical protein KC358_g82 [Hortaea werneckii]|nr:hypothetical protein KC358_g82 [Hortaea werneckii]